MAFCLASYDQNTSHNWQHTLSGAMAVHIGTDVRSYVFLAGWLRHSLSFTVAGRSGKALWVRCLSASSADCYIHRPTIP